MLLTTVLRYSPDGCVGVVAIFISSGDLISFLEYSFSSFFLSFSVVVSVGWSVEGVGRMYGVGSLVGCDRRGWVGDVVALVGCESMEEERESEESHNEYSTADEVKDFFSAT